jgi:uncharacterized membrane protein
MDQDVTVVAGIVIPSTSPVFLTVVAVHVAIALVAVVCGLVGMLSPKCAGRHSRYGKIYFYALCGVFVSASALSFVRWAENYHLFILGAAAFLTALLARTAIRARWRNWPRLHLLGMGTSYVLLLIAFYVDNGRNLPLWRDLPAALYWVIPSAVGVPIMLLVMLRHPLTRTTNPSRTP